MGVKAKLAIQLLANEVVVAESDDAVLWNRVFSAITNDSSEIESVGKESFVAEEERAKGASDRDGKASVNAFAEELGVTVDQLKGACDPTDSVPYIHLDDGSWEQLRKNTGVRGSNSVAPLALAVTLLALWAKHRGADAMPKATDGQKVLNTIHLNDKNPSRSLTNCEWLQQRNGNWVINPAKRSRAVRLARAYVLGESPVEVVAK